eukprot:gene8189-5715_t
MKIERVVIRANLYAYVMYHLSVQMCLSVLFFPGQHGEKKRERNARQYFSAVHSTAHMGRGVAPTAGPPTCTQLKYKKTKKNNNNNKQ